MLASGDAWNSLEVAKLIAGILTPLSVALIGWFISRRLKRLELVQWSNQKLIEKRLAIYDIIAPMLNKLLCFYTWKGSWKNISPGDVIAAKRELDQAVNVYRYLFDAEVYEAYEKYMGLLFETYTGPGSDAKIRAYIKAPDGDRTIHCTYEWDSNWVLRFSDANIPSKEQVRLQYHKLMQALRDSLGVH
jgi:hypothetical protein